MRLIPRVLLPLALVALMPACGKGDLASNSGVAECSVNEDCTTGRVCRASLCTVVEEQPRALGFRLSPPPASTYPPQSVAIQELPSDEPVQIGLDPGVRVAGKLSWQQADGGPGAGQLKFQRRSTTFSAQAAVVENEYEVYLPAGTYDITFFPESADRPTRVWREVTFELDTDPRLQLVQETVRLTGTLSRTDATTRESTTVASARVFATSPTTGVTSSIATTTESGAFSFYVPNDSGVFDLHIAPLEPNSYSEDEDLAHYVPEATFESAFEVGSNEWENLLEGNEGADTLAVSLGEYGYAPLSIPIRLAVDGIGEVDWTGTTVTLRTSAGRGTVAVRQRLAEDGEFTLPLILGLYSAVVRTPPALPVRSMELRDIEIDPQGITLTLQKRANAEGRVLDADGAPVPGAELSFTPLGDENLAQPVSVSTDADGRWSTFIEDTPYVLSVDPGKPNLPRKVVVVRDGAVPGEIRIDEPVLVWGTVFGTPSQAGDDEWRGLPDVSVQVVEADADGLERVIGEGQSNESGEFKVVVGARP